MAVWWLCVMTVVYRTLVTICIAQWSLYVPPSGHLYVPHNSHHMYRKVGTICTAQWSLYVPHSGHLYVPHNSHHMYRTGVTICTAQWSLNVPPCGQYMYGPVVTICTAQWSLYVPHSGHYTYRQFYIQQFSVLPTQLYLCVLCGSQNKQRLFPYTTLTDWFL